MTGLHVGLVCPYSMAVPGGVQNHVLGLAGWLHAAGHRVSVLAPGPVPESLLDQHGLPRAVFTSAGPAVAVRYNGSVARIGVGPGTGRRVHRWLDRTGADVLHLHEPLTPGPALLALRRAGRPEHRGLAVVATFHTATPRSRALLLAGRLLARTIDRIEVRIAVSPTAAQVVRSHLHREAVVVPNGIDHRQFPMSEDTPTVPGRLVFLGRLDEPRKGLDVLLHAWPAILRAHPDAELLVVGAGHRRDLPDRCRAVGRVDDAERARLLSSAELFVAPHRGRESFGLVLVEAMAAGAVVVAADLPAFVDVLTGADGSPCGHLFRTGDPASLAATVIAALGGAARDTDNPRLRARAAEQARRYDWDRVAPDVVRHYRGIGSAAGPRLVP